MPWSRFCSQEKRKKRELCLGGLPSSVPILYLFVPTGKWRNSGKSLKRNGGDDETRTRDLCRDRAAF